LFNGLGNKADLHAENLVAMLTRFQEVGRYSQIMVEPVPMEQERNKRDTPKFDNRKPPTFFKVK
jgi:hypothetical protein